MNTNDTRRRSEYFPISETACRCGCGLDNWSQETMDKMHLARIKFEGPIVVSSWCRCTAHNVSEGGSHTSSHTTGVAVDISLIMTTKLDGVKMLELLTAVYKAGFRRLGFPGQTAKLHVDTDPTKPEALWFY